jgi:hypothetical protein
MATVQEWVTLIKDIVTMLAASVAAYVGFTGLQTWKRQLTANAEHDLARRVLVAVYEVRDAIENCRLMAWDGDDEVSDVTKRLHDSLFDKLDEAKASLAVELLEAEAVWGSEPDYRKCIARFRGLISSLEIAYSTYYAAYRLLDAAGRKAEAYSILFSRGFSKDAFSTQTDDIIAELEYFLRPKLTLKREKNAKNYLWNRLRRKK